MPPEIDTDARSHVVNVFQDEKFIKKRICYNQFNYTLVKHDNLSMTIIEDHMARMRMSDLLTDDASFPSNTYQVAWLPNIFRILSIFLSSNLHRLWKDLFSRLSALSPPTLKRQ